MYHFIWALLLLFSAANAKTKSMFYSNATGVDPIAQETDVVIQYLNTTTTIGEVYQNASSSKPKRFSASYSVYPVSVGETYSIPSPLIIVSQSEDSTKPSSTLLLIAGSSGKVADATSKASSISTSVKTSQPNSNDGSDTASVDADSVAPSSVDAGSIETDSVAPSSNAALVTKSTSKSKSSTSKTSVVSIEDLTKTTKPTTTSVLFSTSASSSLTSSVGTLVTTISSMPSPETTDAASSSTQSTTVKVSTLTNDRTVSDVTGSLSKSTSTVVTTSAITTSSYSLVSIVSQNTTILSTIAVAVTNATVVTSTSATTIASTTVAATTVDLFSAIDTVEPPSVFCRQANSLDLTDGVDNGDMPYETNKFYTNLLVGTQEDSVFVYPYVLWKEDASFAIQHTTADQYVYSDDDLINPLGIAAFYISSTEFDGDANLKMSDMYHTSANAYLVSKDDVSDYIEFPLVQGMGFVSSIFHGSLTPNLTTLVGFSTLVSETSENLAEGILKYKVTLTNSDVSWLVYLTVPDGVSTDSVSLEIEDDAIVLTSDPIDGLILQIAAAPSDSTDEAYYDQTAGMYLTTMQLSGTSDSSTADYQFNYETEGKSASGSPLIFALPHHISLMTEETLALSTGIQLASTTKGTMTAFLTTTFKFSATLNQEVNWLPWSQQLGSDSLQYTTAQLQLLAEVANEEIQVNIQDTISSLNTYYIGKYLAKYALVLLTLSDVIQDETVTLETLENMKDAFDLLLENSQLYPLMYDTTYGGVVSTGDLDSYGTSYDFGNTFYNDHHFHYGYIIHAAAVVGYVDNKYANGTWATENKDWVNSLVRDVANPSLSDNYFAQFRMFDWFHGHSWASGLFESASGKNEESSSEDYNFAYGMKLWGQVIGDQAMSDRGALMLSIMSTSMSDYFLYSDDNDVEPYAIVQNKVSGILFDNSIQYTTYFGTNVEYIHGIHMIPITPSSSQIRSPTFVEEEWSEKLSSIVDSLDSGWLGILKLNQALYDPTASYEFFSSSDFSSSYLDNGLSRTWALAFSGGLANSV